MTEDPFNLESLENIREADDYLFEIISESLDSKVVPVLQKSIIPKSGHAFVMFITKAAFIKNAILDIAESENLYSMNILYRSLFDHYLKFHFLFNRSLKNRDDEAANDYYLYCDIEENLSFIENLKKGQKIFGMPENIEAAWDLLTKHRPELKNLKLDEVKKKASQFQYKNLIRSLWQDFSRKPDAEGFFLLKLILPEYSELSSYVHGGVFAEYALGNFADNQKRERAIIGTSRTTFFLFWFIVHFTYVAAFQFDKSLKEPLLKITEIIRKPQDKSPESNSETDRK